MAVSKPTKLPRWLDDPTRLDSLGRNEVVEPPEITKDDGWQIGKSVPAPYLNWLFSTIYAWCAWLNDLQEQAFTWTAQHAFGVSPTVPDAPAAHGAANKVYVDSQDAQRAALTGAHFTGGVICDDAPALDSSLTRKDYVDAAVHSVYQFAALYGSTGALVSSCGALGNAITDASHATGSYVIAVPGMTANGVAVATALASSITAACVCGAGTVTVYTTDHTGAASDSAFSVLAMRL